MKSFKELEKKAHNGVADRVILAAVKDSYTYHADVMKILEQIIDSDSRWRDRAYWKKAHSISRLPCMQYGYLHGSKRLLSELASHIKNNKFSTLNSKQQQALDSALEDINNIITDKEADVPAWIRYSKLDLEGLLYDDIDDGSSHKIPRYLKAIQITKPEGTLPPHITEWLDSLNIPPLRIMEL